jgi:transposase
MLHRDVRAAVLELHRQGHGVRAIARALRISRSSVRRVLEQGSAEVPELLRPDKLTESIDLVRELYASCEGNLVRVHEELEARDVHVGYATLTAFCRRQRIGVETKLPAGFYHFDPAEEMQHDTSPHRVVVGGQLRRLECASLVLCYSHMIFAQAYPRWNRFWCKVFLTAALRYFGGAAKWTMLDNSSIIIVSGTGANAVAAPEMVALATLFGFKFVAHEKGDANRSARVERPFDYIEHNFYVGRTFADVADLNRQFVIWCDQVNAKFRRSLRASHRELFAVERPKLQRLPLHIPDPSEFHQRTVDTLGYVTVHTNNYSVPCSLLDRSVDVIATSELVRIFDGHRLVCEHPREEDGAHQRCTLKAHREERQRLRLGRQKPSPQEQTLMTAAPELAELVAHLKSRHRGRAIRPIRRLHQMFLDYPTDPLCAAIRRALDHGLYDLQRIEAIVLKQLSGSFFREPDSLLEPHPPTNDSPSGESEKDSDDDPQDQDPNAE